MSKLVAIMRCLLALGLRGSARFIFAAELLLLARADCLPDAVRHRKNLTNAAGESYPVGFAVGTWSSARLSSAMLEILAEAWRWWYGSHHDGRAVVHVLSWPGPLLLEVFVTKEEMLGYNTRRCAVYENQPCVWHSEEWIPRRYPRGGRGCMRFWAALPGKMQRTVAVPTAAWSAIGPSKCYHHASAREWKRT